MDKKILIKKTIDCIDEHYKNIKIMFSVVILKDKYYILEIFDSKGRHYSSQNLFYTDETVLNKIYSNDFDISYCFEPNFYKMRNDVWIHIYVDKCSYILYQKDLTYSEDEILFKIKSLENEIILLKEKYDLMEK